jgi:hypothetical protein
MCEVRDYVLTSTAPELFVREQNEAANDEQRRRGTPALVVPSGQLVGDAIVWSPFPLGCAQGWIDPGTL